MIQKPVCKLLVLLLPAAILLASCNVNDDDGFRDTFSYQISEQSVIKANTTSRPITQDSSVTVFEFSVEPGDSTVFQYEHKVIAPPRIADGGFFETLVFQVSDDVNTFEFRDAELQNAVAFYSRSCFCLLAGAGFKATSGVIRGERLTPLHWIVRADVTIESAAGTFSVQFNEPFFVK